MRKVKNKKSWISRLVIWAIVLQLVSPGISAAAEQGSSFGEALDSKPGLGWSVTDAVYQVQNPSFETGDMTGWMVVSGEAFGPDSVSNETTWWAEQIPYHQEGTYHLNGWKYSESATGVLRSSTFELGGSGWISFKLGGAKILTKYL